MNHHLIKSLLNVIPDVIVYDKQMMLTTDERKTQVLTIWLTMFFETCVSHHFSGATNLRKIFKKKHIDEPVYKYGQSYVKPLTELNNRS